MSMTVVPVLATPLDAAPSLKDVAVREVKRRGLRGLPYRGLIDSSNRRWSSCSTGGRAVAKPSSSSSLSASIRRRISEDQFPSSPIVVSALVGGVAPLTIDMLAVTSYCLHWVQELG